MNTVERIYKLCEERGVSIEREEGKSLLEKWQEFVDDLIDHNT